MERKNPLKQLFKALKCYHSSENAPVLILWKDKRKKKKQPTNKLLTHYRSWASELSNKYEVSVTYVLGTRGEENSSRGSRALAKVLQGNRTNGTYVCTERFVNIRMAQMIVEATST